MVILHLFKYIIPSIFAIFFRIFGLGFKSKKKLTVGLVLFFLYNLIVPSVLFLIMDYKKFEIITPFIILLGSAFILIFSNDSFKITVFLILIVMQGMVSITLILNIVSLLFPMSELLYVIILIVGNAVLFFLALKFASKPLRFIADNMTIGLFIPILINSITILLTYLIPTSLFFSSIGVLAGRYSG